MESSLSEFSTSLTNIETGINSIDTSLSSIVNDIDSLVALVRSIKNTLNDFYETVAYGLFYANDDDDVDDPNGYGTPYLYLIYKQLEEEVVESYYPNGEYEGQDISVATGDQIDTIKNHFSWITDAKDTFTDTMTAIQVGEATTIDLSISTPNSSFLSGINGSISNTWYTPFKELGDKVISAFMWLGFIIWFTSSVPNIVSGAVTLRNGSSENIVLEDYDGNMIEPMRRRRRK